MRSMNAKDLSISCPKESKVRMVIVRSAGTASQAPIGSASSTDGLAHQDQTDQQVIELWLHGRSPATQRAYRSDANRLSEFVSSPLHAVTLGDLQAFADHLLNEGLSPASQHRTLSAIKSLIGFAHRLGYLQFDTARPLRLPTLRNQLAERILEDSDIRRMILLEPDERNRLMLTLMYMTGVRVSEVCGLRWRDCVARESGAQITVHGKGGKTRAILIPGSLWRDMESVRSGTGMDLPVFASRKGGSLSSSGVWRIVRAAARRAGIDANVSPHWMRHAHASHALDAGAPIHVLQATLGHVSVATTGAYLHARPTESSSTFISL